MSRYSSQIPIRFILKKTWAIYKAHSSLLNKMNLTNSIKSPFWFLRISWSDLVYRVYVSSNTHFSDSRKIKQKENIFSEVFYAFIFIAINNIVKKYLVFCKIRQNKMGRKKTPLKGNAEQWKSTLIKVASTYIRKVRKFKFSTISKNRQIMLKKL